ncbi:hypothetical protein T310_2322 [Rasamsonia emersonii CBS 393.64]|uniref:Uncharacterized protein n=1 Tax=Rasamsonia emersonii (strain ATCC 16479 / CBS 393.64 / IMI 116815) TaxID=1408163 RepID=A0A0F4YZI9_RASE3|nr:hypothetical protein T310_2322 [Rasamsonia emersonii CBS 393.64]KKA23644.1 hypothetical protein T310_2322 [Rasamsonia emersonii CBS 393.64]
MCVERVTPCPRPLLPFLLCRLSSPRPRNSSKEMGSVSLASWADGFSIWHDPVHGLLTGSPRGPRWRWRELTRGCWGRCGEWRAPRRVTPDGSCPCQAGTRPREVDPAGPRRRRTVWIFGMALPGGGGDAPSLEDPSRV